MIKSFLINKYLGFEFLKIVIKTCIIFFALGIIMNLFEEINFFKDYGVSVHLPVFLTLLFVPSLLNDFFPFVILISGIWFFLKIKKSHELTAVNISGISNFSVILIPGILSIVLGIFFVTSVNPLTSIMVKNYEKIKGAYEQDQEYLASITNNGIWIKEKNTEKNNIIRAFSLEGQSLIEVTIYEFDKNNDFVRRIEAKKVDISFEEWSLENVKILTADGIFSSKNENSITYNSMFNAKKLRSLYSNLDTVSFWSLNNEIKLLEERGYSTSKMKVKLHRSLAFPLFLLSMILLSSFFTLGVKTNENKWHYVFLTIISSVLIFFFNDFSAVLGETEKLPLEAAVWMPILIIFIFSSVGIIHANQK